MVAIALLVIFFISRANNQLQKSNNIEISYNEFFRYDRRGYSEGYFKI